MSDVREALRAWLEFAREMGIEGLLAPPLALPAPAVAAAPGAARAGVAAGARPAAPARGAAEPDSRAALDAGASGGSPLERLREVVAGPAAARAKPPGSSAPRPGAAPASPASAASPATPAGSASPESPESAPTARAPLSATPGFGPVRRLETIPAELQVSPASRFEKGGAPAPVGPPRTLDDVRAEIGDCQRCKLAKGRTNIVFGVGNPEAELMFVGEGPGRDEDLQGEPFVGRAGQLLNDIIKAIGMAREQVYIANVVKCRPPENRTPEPDEVASCRGFLFKQMALIRPRVIVALGKPAAETLLQKPVPITAVRGQVIDFFGAKLVPTFHPAYLLRNPPKKREVWEDMKLVRELLRTR